MYRIRSARPDDLPCILELWADYLAESEKHGSHERATPLALDWYAAQFHSFTLGLTPGLVLVVENPDEIVGVLGAMGVTLRGDHSLGKVVEGMGTYVHPDSRGNGLSRRLHQEAIRRLTDMGYDTYMASYSPTNPGGQRMLESAGARVLQVTTVLDLGPRKETTP